MATDALSAARPSRSDRFRDTILLFVAIRDRDLDTVRRLLRRRPRARQRDGRLVDRRGAGGRAAVRLRGPRLGVDPCGRDRRRRARSLLRRWRRAGARRVQLRGRGVAALGRSRSRRPRGRGVPARRGCRSEHAGVRGCHTAPRCHAARAPRPRPPTARGGCGPGSGRRPRPDPGRLARAPPAGAARNLEAVRFRAHRDPRRRSASRRCTGSAQHWPPAVGLGQTVLLFAIAEALRPAEFWLLGFEHGPYSQAGAEQETRETGVECTVRLARAGADARARRARLRQHARGVRPVSCTEAGCTPRRSGARTTTCCSPARSSRAIRTCSPRSSSSPSTGPIRTSRRNRPKASTRRSPSTGIGRSVRCGPPSNRRAPGVVGTRASGTSSSRPPCAIGSPTFRSKAMRRCRRLARYFAQPFTLAEPFTSRPGERTAYDTMLDEVEALVSGE